MKSIYLHKDDLQTILQFMRDFPESHTVEILYDNSSGIGAKVDAVLHGIDLNGNIVSVTKNIVDESSW